MRGGESTRRNRQCPPGYILRRGYTRKYRSSLAHSGFTVRRKGKVYTVRPKTQSIRVSASCVKDRGLPGKGPALGEGFGKLRKGDLVKYGYQYRLSDALRHRALKKAVKQYGKSTVYHKLNAVAKLSKRTAPDASNIFARDRNWVKQQNESFSE